MPGFEILQSQVHNNRVNKSITVNQRVNMINFNNSQIGTGFKVAD